MYSNSCLEMHSATRIVDQYMSSFDRFQHSGTCAIVYHHYVFALVMSGRYGDAGTAQDKLTALAAREGIDARSRAYALASAIFLSCIIASRFPSIETFERHSNEAIALASTADDAYLQFFAQFAIGWVELHRGRSAKAQQAAQTLLAIGRRMDDPRSIGFGMNLLGWNALATDDYQAALGFTEIGIGNARTLWDRVSCNNVYCSALVLLKRPEGYQTFQNAVDQMKDRGWLYMLTGADGIMGVALAIRGELAASIRWMEEVISKREKETTRVLADWYRLFLCEIYLEIISGKEKPPLNVLIRNAHCRSRTFQIRFDAR